MTAKIIVISLYALMIIVIGIIGLKKTKSFNDFFLGGGNVGPWMTAFSYGTAYFSAVLFIGFAGNLGWNFGYSSLWIALFNSIIGVLGVWYLMGWKIKKMSSEYGVSTMSEFLEKRYSSPKLKMFSSIVIFVFLIPYTAAVFMGLSYLFVSNFGIEYWYSLVFMGTFTAIYLALGGYKSMTMIDMIFGMIMVVGVAILIYSTIDKAGGLSAITANLSEINPKLTEMVGPPGLWMLFCLIFLTSIAPFGMPQLVQKFYAIKDRKAIRIGMFASTAFALLIGFGAYFTGTTTRFFLSPENAPNAFKAGGEPIVDRLMPEILVQVVPEALSVIILLLVLSASMSTLAALVLISSSSLAKDFYHGFINKNASDKTLTKLMRAASVFFILLSVILAYLEPKSIVAILSISWGAIGAAFLGPFIWGLFWKGATRAGAFVSGVGGLAVTLILYMNGCSSPEAGTIGMIASLVLNPIVSLVTKEGRI